MPRKPTPPPEPELAVVRAFAEALVAIERAASQLRTARNTAMLAAKRAGATGDHLAQAARIARQNVHGQLVEAGYDPQTWRTPPSDRNRSTS